MKREAMESGAGRERWMEVQEERGEQQEKQQRESDRGQTQTRARSTDAERGG